MSRKRFAQLHHHHLAACIIGWLIRMSYFCQCSYLLNFQFVFWQTEEAAVMPLLLFLCVCVSVSAILLSLGQHPEASEEDWPRWKFLLEISTVPAAYGHMLTLHLSHNPLFHPVLNQTPHPSTSTLYLLRAQSMTIITIKHAPFAVTRRRSLNTKVPAHRRLHPFSGCPRLIFSCSILKERCLHLTMPDSTFI